jgi:hypothetical protein
LCSSTYTSSTEIISIASLEPESPAQLSAMASFLCQSLERELLYLASGRPVSPQMKEMYDAVYLPRLIAFSHQAGRYVEYPDWQLLCQPLHPDLAASQLRIVVEILDLIVMAFKHRPL